jgi:hypothetical protein
MHSNHLHDREYRGQPLFPPQHQIFVYYISGLTSAQKDIPALDILHSLISRRVDLVALGYVLRVSSEYRPACTPGRRDDQGVDSAGEDGHRIGKLRRRACW